MKKNVWITIWGIVGKLAAPALLFIINRSYGTELAGVYFGLIALVEMLLAGIVGGYKDGVMTFTAVSEKNDENATSVLGAALRVTLPSGIVAGISFSIIAFSGAHFFPAEEVASYAGLLLYMAPMLPVLILERMLESALQGRKIMFYEAAVNGWLRPLLQVGFAFAFSFVSADVHGLGLTFIGMQTGALLFGLYGYYRHASLSALWKSFFTGTAQPKLHAFSLAQNANMLFNKITSGLDLLLLPVLGVPAFEVGAYATISGLFRELRQIKLAFSTALAPFLAAFLHQEKKIETSKRITYVSGLLMLLITPTLLFLWQFHVPLISLFLPRYEADFSLIALLSFVPLLYTVFSLMGNVLVAAGLSRPLLFNSVLATASLAGLLFVFVPEFGLTGAAFSSAGAMAIMSFLEVWQAKRLCGVTFLLKIWLPLVLACFFLLLVTFFLNNFGALQTYTMLVPWLLYGIIAFRYREFFKLPDFA